MSAGVRLIHRFALILACAAVTGGGRDGMPPQAQAADEPAAGAEADKAEPKAPKGRRFALLVGCTKYTNLPESRWLKGPANDVKEFRRVLTARYGFKDENVKVLAEEAGDEDRPTRQHIVDEFDRLVKTVGPGDQGCVLLSGHGSQQPDHPDPHRDDPEPDGLDEIFLPADIGKFENEPQMVENAIVDDELSEWIHAIAAKGACVWAILEFSHAGGAIDRYDAARNEESSGTARGVGRAGNIVAFYACESDGFSVELPMPPASEAGKGPRTRHGLLAYTVLNILELADASELTYRDLGQQVLAKYKGWGRFSPTPFIDGTALDRLILGTGRGQFHLTLKDKTKAGWTLNGGIAHG